MKFIKALLTVSRGFILIAGVGELTLEPTKP
jgi:hypothetical protein